jgi:hypothetical protein
MAQGTLEFTGLKGKNMYSNRPILDTGEPTRVRFVYNGKELTGEIQPLPGYLAGPKAQKVIAVTVNNNLILIRTDTVIEWYERGSK